MRKSLSLLLALVMTFSLVVVGAGAKDFTDSDSLNYRAAVDVISEIDVVDGYEGGAFNGSNTLTRGAASKIICNLVLGPTTASALGANSAPFKDVPASNTFAGYITYCSQQGIISGYADGTFKPAATVTGYQFMKMLLGALGYDSQIEGFVGPNYTVPVAKLAVSLGLADGLVDENGEPAAFVGSRAMTREEACLYAFNTLDTVMVEYDTKSTIVIDGVSVTTGGGSAKEVPNTAATETIDNDNKMQFAERYFTNLRKSATTDEFERPATNWRIRSSSIGTYNDSPDLSYSAAVKLGSIYSDLGLSAAIPVTGVSYFINGSVPSGSNTENAAELAKYSNGVARNSNVEIGGNGVITEVYYDADSNTAVITHMNVYLGEVTATRAATSSRDAYITIAPKSDNVSVGGNFETETTYAVDDLVLYNYSTKTGDAGVYFARPATESVTGTLSSFTNSSNITVAGTQYKVNKANKADITGLENATDNDITIYLDENGYVVFVDTNAISNNYAVVLAADNTGVSDQAKLLLSDGTIRTVTVNSVVEQDAPNAEIGVAGLTTAPGGDIVTYSARSNGRYNLVRLSASDPGTNVLNTAGAAVMTKNNSTVNATVFPYDEINTEATNKPASGSTPYANGKTIFLVRTGANTYHSYTGIANVPTVSLTAATNTTIIHNAYSKNVVNGSTGSYPLTLVYVDATDSNLSVAGASSDVVFVKGSSTGASYDSALGNYYTYKAVVNGEYVDNFKTTTQTLTNTVYNTVSYDTASDGTKIAVLTNGANNTPGNASKGTATDGAFYGVGTDRTTSGVVGLGGTYVSFANDCKVFRIDVDGNLSENASTANSIYADSNDLVWFKTVNGDVKLVVIQETETPVVPPTPAGFVHDAQAQAELFARVFYYGSLPNVVAIHDYLASQGCTNIKKTANPNEWDFTYKSVNFASATVAPTPVYKMTNALNATATAGGVTVSINGLNSALAPADGFVDGNDVYLVATKAISVKVHAEGPATGGAAKTFTFTNMTPGGLAFVAGGTVAGMDGAANGIDGQTLKTAAAGGAVSADYTLTLTIIGTADATLTIVDS